MSEVVIEKPVDEDNDKAQNEPVKISAEELHLKLSRAISKITKGRPVSEKMFPEIEKLMGPLKVAAQSTPSAAITGKGGGISYSLTSGGTQVPLAEVRSANLPESTVGNVDATHLLSPNNFVEKKSIVWQDVSDVPLVLNYTKGTTASLYAVCGLTVYWTYTLPDNSTYVFPGFLSKLGGSAMAAKDLIQQNVSITVTGAVVFTPGS